MAGSLESVRVVVAVVLVALAAATGCADDDGGEPEAGSSTAGPIDTEAATAGATAGDLCDGATSLELGGAVETPGLTEISGLATSRTTTGVIWAHDDSGGEPQVWALGLEGSGSRPYTLQGADARDWEDLAAGPGPGGEPFLFVGDIGDNGASRDAVTVYLAPEPTVDVEGSGGTITDVDALTVRYEGGATDAEALLADPVTGDLVVVAKSLLGGPVAIYRIPADALVDPDPAAPVTARRVGDVQLDLGPGQAVTGGDVSRDGSVVALRTYGGVLLWDRAEGETVPDALEGEPCEAASVEEQQGEAIAFSDDGRGYVTISEGANPPVNWFRLPDG